MSRDAVRDAVFGISLGLCVGIAFLVLTRLFFQFIYWITS